MYFSLGEASVTVARLSPRVKLIFISLLGFFVLTLVYQLVLVLGVDLKGITQVPDFAKSNRLSIAYLLSSHYFEHVLDSIYFVLIVMLAFRGSWKLSTSRSTSK